MNQLSQSTIETLITKASEARAHAFAPYSGFLVGSALLSDSGEIFTGCNVEISSYSLTCCAERNALFHAVACGKKIFVAIAIVAEHADCPPCGACRQALADFNPELTIIQSDVHRTYSLTSLRELFPKPFSLSKKSDGPNSH